MSEENTSVNCLKSKANWALILAIVSVALNVILITALIAGGCSRKKDAGKYHPGFGKGAPGMQCPMGAKGQYGKFAGKHHRGEFGRAGEHRGGKFGGKGLERLAAELNLDAAQQASIQKIMADQKAQFVKLDGQAKPEEFKKIMADGKAKIRAVLKPDQQKKFDDMTAKFQAKFEAGRSQR